MKTASSDFERARSLYCIVLGWSSCISKEGQANANAKGSTTALSTCPLHLHLFFQFLHLGYTAYDVTLAWKRRLHVLYLPHSDVVLDISLPNPSVERFPPALQNAKTEHVGMPSR
jgi:hypothetical protein